MYLLVNILEQSEHLTGILEGFAGIGIKGSTVLNSTGMGRVLMQSHAGVGITEEIDTVVNSCEPTNRTLLTLIPDKDILDKATDIIRSFCGDLSEPGKGVLFVLPIEYAEGLAKSS